MKLLIALALAAAAEARLATPHALFGAEQLSFLDATAHCEGCQPDYCYPRSAAPDYDCYKSGYPKCCTKSKGNCPNNKHPDCECEGACPNNIGMTGDSCVVGEGGCKGGTYCNAEDGVCGDAPGRCVTMATQCGRELLPVCGCNGVTYQNRCEASAVGVSVAANYACGEAAPCTLDGDDCGSGDFCSVDDGQCNLKMAGIQGVCRPKRAGCNLSFHPVCGCDGVTYDNADCAKAAGTNVAAEGAC